MLLNSNEYSPLESVVTLYSLSTITTTFAPFIGLFCSSTSLPEIIVLFPALTGVVAVTVIVVFNLVTVILLNISALSGSTS